MNLNQVDRAVTINAEPSGSLLVAAADAAAHLRVADADVAELTDVLRLLGDAFRDALGYPRLGWTDLTEAIHGPLRARRRLWLRQRPVGSVTSVTDSAGDVLDADEYAIVGGSCLRRADGWADGEADAGLVWSIRYKGGWWLADASGEKPAAASVVPYHVRRLALLQLRADWSARSRDPEVTAMAKAGASIRFRGDQAADDASTHGVLLPEVAAGLAPLRAII